MAILYNNNPWGSYDSWRTTDVWGDRAWEEEYYHSWVESLVRIDYPDADEEMIQQITRERVVSGYYDPIYEF